MRSVIGFVLFCTLVAVMVMLLRPWVQSAITAHHNDPYKGLTRKQKRELRYEREQFRIHRERQALLENLNKHISDVPQDTTDDPDSGPDPLKL